MTRRLSPEALREAAEVAAATGVCIVIEHRGRVYRIDPPGQSLPVTMDEKDRGPHPLGLPVVPSRYPVDNADLRIHEPEPAAEDYMATLERDGYQCRYCGSRREPTVDHVFPLARGGDHSPDNLATACRSCNSSKGIKLLHEEWTPPCLREGWAHGRPTSGLPT